MKESTIEQKARAYDEAKSIMEKYLKSGNAGVIAENTIKKAFPELAESEDEKIRREIIRIVDIWTGSSPVVNGIPRETLLAWLEKQVEQKSTWNEEDEQNYDIILKIICSSNKSENLVNELFNWFKSLKNRVQLKNLIVTDEELAQAKKDAYNNALDKIEYYSAEPTFDDGWNAAIWYLKKRNAQPQNTWKPSDEQIGVIEAVINNRSFQRRHLDSLYEQLKKLK